MKNNPTTLKAKRAPWPDAARGRGLEWDFAAMATSFLCVAMLVGVAGCSANDTPNQEVQTAPTTSATSSDRATVRGGEDGKCYEMDYQAVDAQNNQSIILVVTRNDVSEPRYKITPSPRCVQLSHKGSLTFTVNWDAVNKDLNWQPGSYVSVTFGVPGPLDPPPAIKGPFERDKGKKNKRGIYDGIQDSVTIPPKYFSTLVKTNWVDTYTASAWDPDGEFLGEVDPGVKVIDDPGVTPP